MKVEIKSFFFLNLCRIGLVVQRRTKRTIDFFYCCNVVKVKINNVHVKIVCVEFHRISLVAPS